MSNLINHPDLLKKARVDLNNQIGLEKLINKLDISKLHYLQCIIPKTFQLYPAAPLLVPHFPSNDWSMHGPYIGIPNCGKILLVLNLRGLKLVRAIHIS